MNSLLQNHLLLRLQNFYLKLWVPEGLVMSESGLDPQSADLTSQHLGPSWLYVWFSLNLILFLSEGQCVT